MAIIIWLAIAAVLILFEIVTLGLTTIWFAGGALAAALAAYFGAHWLAQIMLFAVVSLILLIFTRPLAVKHLMKDNEKTNAEGLVGETGIVINTIDNIKAEGIVKLNGLEWTARSDNDEIIEKDSVVEVKAIRGVKLIVAKK